MENNNFAKLTPTETVNVKRIRWIKLHENCYHVCTKTDGCNLGTSIQVCNNDPGFNFIQRLFESKK